MMDMDEVRAMPDWVRDVIGAPGTRDQQFDAVMGAFARSHQRPGPPTAEDMIAIKKAHKRANPLHVKAVARRRKRKRGGPK